MKKLLVSSILCLLVLGGRSAASNVGKEIYGIYGTNSSGIKLDVRNVPGEQSGSDPDGGCLVNWGYCEIFEGGKSGAWPKDESLPGFKDTTAFPEGDSGCVRARVFSVLDDAHKHSFPEVLRSGGWYVQFGYSREKKFGMYGANKNKKVPTVMTQYKGGTLNFAVKTSTDIAVRIEWGKDMFPFFYFDEKRLNADLKVPLDNKWYKVSVPISCFVDLNLSSVTVPAGFNVIYKKTRGMWWVSGVYWKKPSGEEAKEAVVTRISDNMVVSRVPEASISKKTIEEPAMKNIRRKWRNKLVFGLGFVLLLYIVVKIAKRKK